MTEYFIVTLILFFLTGIYFAFRCDVKTHIFYLFITFIQIFYLFNTPVRNFIIGDYYAIGTNIEDFYCFGFSMLVLHVLLFNIFYLVTSKNKVLSGKVIEERYAIKSNRIFASFIILFTIIFVNSLAGGVNLFDILQGKEVGATLGLRGASYYIQNLADSLITLIVASFIFKTPSKHKIVMCVLGLFLFIILGFRYRILLTIFALVIYYIHENGLKVKSLMLYVTFFMVFFYSLMFLTHNRYYFYFQLFDEVSFNPYDFSYDVMFDQAKGSLVDFAFYKGLSDGTISHDYGETAFKYIFVKMAPSSLFPDGVKPYPPPQMSAVDEAINASRDIGEAVTFLGASYFAFSYFGLIAVSAFLGFYIKKIALNSISNRMFLINVMTLMAIFQLCTRGYFPQFVDHLAYMLIPLLFIQSRANKQSRKMIYINNVNNIEQNKFGNNRILG